MKRWVRAKGVSEGRLWEVVGESEYVWVVRHYDHDANIATFIELPKEDCTFYTDVPLIKED